MDEYDAPIGHALHKPELTTAIREAMSALYIHLKANVDKLRFLMMTDVSKFSQTLNALTSRDFPNFFANLKTLYADLPYGSTEGENVMDAAYLRLLYVLLRSHFSNLEVCFERQQAGARPDLVFTHSRSIFIFELKVNRDGKSDTAAEAL